MDTPTPATTSDEVVFFDGQTLSDVLGDDGSDGNAPAVAPESAPAVAPESAPAVAPAVAPESAPADQGEITGEEAGENEVQGILRKYGNDPGKLAAAYRALQQDYTRKSQLLASVAQSRIAQPQFQFPAPASYQQPSYQQQGYQQQGYQQHDPRASEPQTGHLDTPSNKPGVDPTRLQSITQLLASDPEAGIGQIISEAEQAGRRAFQEAQRVSEMQRIESEQRATQEHNAGVIEARARELLASQAAARGESPERYLSPNYKLVPADYQDVYFELDSEITAIQQRFNPRDGKLTPELFRVVSMIPANQHQSATTKGFQQMPQQQRERGDNTPRYARERVALQPGQVGEAGNGNGFHLDLDSFQGSPTDAQLLFDKMNAQQRRAVARQLGLED